MGFDTYGVLEPILLRYKKTTLYNHYCNYVKTIQWFRDNEAEQYCKCIPSMKHMPILTLQVFVLLRKHILSQRCAFWSFPSLWICTTRVTKSTCTAMGFKDTKNKAEQRIPLSFSWIAAIKMHSCWLPRCFVHLLLCNMHQNVLYDGGFSKLDSFVF